MFIYIPSNDENHASLTSQVCIATEFNLTKKVSLENLMDYQRLIIALLVFFSLFGAPCWAESPSGITDTTPSSSDSKAEKSMDTSNGAVNSVKEVRWRPQVHGKVTPSTPPKIYPKRINQYQAAQLDKNTSFTVVYLRV